MIALTLAWPGLLLAEPTEVDASSAGTRPGDEAESLIGEGIELRKQGDDRRALAAFERALELEASPRALAQLALAEQALGRWLDAHAHLDAALQQTADAWITEHRGALEAALLEIASRLGSLEVTCNVPAADIRLDGHVIGHTPLATPVRVVAGQSVIQVSAKGHLDITRHVHVDPGKLARVEITLTPALSREGGWARATADARRPPGQRTVAERAVERHVGPASREVLLYASAGVGALGVAIGVTGYVMREKNLRLYNDEARCNAQLGIRRSEECPDEAAAWQRGEALAIGGFSGAAVFGAATAYLWLTRPEKQEHGGGVACAVDASLGVRCSGRF